MTPLSLHAAVALCAAALLAAAPLAATAANATRTPASSDQPKPRVGTYRIVSRGPTVTHAKCVEGGNVFVSAHAKDTAAQRDRAIRDACKTTDYTK